jgi:2-polyprenyl-6-methoxyphenol hydroxylase-like FAD-dependent oxidoreductase
MVETIKTRCCIVGGGPAGMMAGFLLARNGVDVVVLEKHKDFLRDFRGDTLHPSTLELMNELGLLDKLLQLPHDEASELHAMFGEETVTIADFRHLPTRCKFIAFMPQWDFLNFLASEATLLPKFSLRLETPATDLLLEDGNVVGVCADSPRGKLQIRCDLVIAADGRHSTLRGQAGFAVHDFDVPIDVLWMRVSREPGDPQFTLGRISPGHLLVMLDRGAYWQCAFIIRKGAFDEIKQRGLEEFRASLVAAAPFLKERTNDIATWDAVKLLSVSVDRLDEWARPGLLCIGDCAHAMSPVGGVGINLAIQDAVATSNILSSEFRAGKASLESLKQVQKRRWFPTTATQRLQVFLHDHGVQPILAARSPIPLPWPFRLLNKYPILRRIPARIIGLGFRPEHIRPAP